MRPPRFLVAQVGRTGSGYTAAVLTAAGIPCGHEEWFNPTGARRPGLLGDSSWPATADLAAGRYDGIVFHQVREPLVTLASLREEGVGTAYGSPYLGLRYGLCGLPSGDPFEDVLRVWVTMNDLIEKASPRMRWQVEELDTAILARIAGEVGIVIDAARAVEALEEIPRDVNAHGVPAEHYRVWDDYPAGAWRDRALELARAYGYVT